METQQLSHTTVSVEPNQAEAHVDFVSQANTENINNNNNLKKSTVKHNRIARNSTYTYAVESPKACPFLDGISLIHVPINRK